MRDVEHVDASLSPVVKSSRFGRIELARSSAEKAQEPCQQRAAMADPLARDLLADAVPDLRRHRRRRQRLGEERQAILPAIDGAAVAGIALTAALEAAAHGALQAADGVFGGDQL